MLGTESTAGRVVDIDPDGHTVWEWIHKPYDESRLPILTGAHRAAVTRTDVAARRCSSADATNVSKDL